ncbi:MAG: hypothetical protein GC203_01100 [Phenylobacterium sp.]|uniref:CC_3452 family protein n=1 Tax=Phenylobacterium sp. TaxID=1871053 RepID=UPI0025F6F87F|nr:hypothetical protein [Phenylobacterium sp.]MBI1196440.1 hypothetical protein [Phenylobacterium sp.]
MQISKWLGAGAAMAVFVSGAALAQTAGYRGEATLATPGAAPREAVIAGVTWRCDGDECAGSAVRKGNLDGLVRECRKVAAVVGPISRYKSGPRELSDSQLRACNRGAQRMQTAGN